MSADFQMVISGLGGAGVVVLAGLAAFGVGSIITAPAMIGTGAVLCIKGGSLKKKAIENKKQAKELAKSVDEVVTYYAELREAAKNIMLQFLLFSLNTRNILFALRELLKKRLIGKSITTKKRQQ